MPQITSIIPKLILTPCKFLVDPSSTTSSLVLRHVAYNNLLASGQKIYATVSGVTSIYIVGTVVVTEPVGEAIKYTCTSLSPALTQVPTWAAKSGQLVSVGLSEDGTPGSFTSSAVNTVVRVEDEITLIYDQINDTGTYLQLKASALTKTDVISSISAVITQ